MHTHNDHPTALTQDELERLDQVRALTDDLDFTTTEGADQARVLLREYGLPEYMIYTLRRVPPTEAAMRWAETRAQELRNSGRLVR